VIISPGIVILIFCVPHHQVAFRVVHVKLKFVQSVISSIAHVQEVLLPSNLFVAIESIFIFTHSTATTHALTLDNVVSEACQSSIVGV
jgi:hypothetical protein